MKLYLMSSEDLFVGSFKCWRINEDGVEARAAPLNERFINAICDITRSYFSRTECPRFDTGQARDTLSAAVCHLAWVKTR